MGESRSTEETVGRTDVDTLLNPVLGMGRGAKIFLVSMAAVAGWGVLAYLVQLSQGLVVTAMRDEVLWGLYISNFVFFIGISHAGTFISAILRVAGAEWRRPVTRLAEAITVFALLIGFTMPLVDLGRPERMLNLLFYGRIQSPIIWDFLSITAYLIGSSLFLYVALIPDIAILRDRLGDLPSWRARLYRLLSANWRGTVGQKRRLKRSLGIMAVLIIPVMITVHTVVSWIFGMTLRAGWNSTNIGPFFVVGAILSGVASVIMAMALFRRFYHLEDYIRPEHFRYMALLLLAVDIVYIYFTLNEFLPAAYHSEPAEIEVLRVITTGAFSGLFWFSVGSLLFGGVLLALKRTRTITGIFVASAVINVAMWIKRYVIIIPTLVRPQVPDQWAAYLPTWVEWSIIAGSMAGFVLLYALFSKFFPIVSIWEVTEKVDR